MKNKIFYIFFISILPIILLIIILYIYSIVPDEIITDKDMDIVNPKIYTYYHNDGKDVIIGLFCSKKETNLQDDLPLYISFGFFSKGSYKYTKYNVGFFEKYNKNHKLIYNNIDDFVSHYQTNYGDCDKNYHLHTFEFELKKSTNNDYSRKTYVDEHNDEYDQIIDAINKYKKINIHIMRKKCVFCKTYYVSSNSVLLFDDTIKITE